MSCLKTCGYVCGGLAALNIWFWIGMTVFNAMGNPWITKEIIGKENYTDDVSSFTTAFGLCILLNALCMVGCCGCTKAGCYQDKDKVVYYVPGKEGNGGFDQMRAVNGSDGGPGVSGRYNGVAQMERQEAANVAGSKLIR